MVLAIIQQEINDLFNDFKIDNSWGIVSVSKRSDLSDLQCNGAFQAAKTLRSNPLEIAQNMREVLIKSKTFSKVTINSPGFINLTLSDKFIIESLLNDKKEKYQNSSPQKIIIDYGGPNIAKPLHIGHLRSAIIGESIKRTARELGHYVIADIHLGDWGIPIGLLIAILNIYYPEWFCFQNKFIESSEVLSFPINVEELNTLYIKASKMFKENEDFAKKAREATKELQNGHKGYRELWKYLVNISLENIKKDFKKLDVSFDLWFGESNTSNSISEVLDLLFKKKIAYESYGAIVIDVSYKEDKHLVPPIILRKADGAYTYAMTDLVTIYQRVKNYNPDNILYVVDQRQSLHFQQVFRAAAKTGIIEAERLTHIGFGTINGQDGKPFKTRSGDIIKLSDVIQIANEFALRESGLNKENIDLDEHDMINKVAIAAIKFGDLSNLRTTDYAFNIEEFIKFEGKTGPYLQYAFVRAVAILNKVGRIKDDNLLNTKNFSNKAERDLSLSILYFPYVLERAFKKQLPSDLCEYAYELAYKFNRFYNQCPIINEKDMMIKVFRLILTKKTKETLKKVLQCLGIPVPRKMMRVRYGEEN